MEVSIVQASQKHLYTLTVLTKQFFPYVNFSIEEVKRRFSDPNTKYFIAEVDGGTVGFVDYEVQGDKCKLMGLAVLDSYRGNGIAKKLVEEVLIQARLAKCVNVFLLVSVDNFSAVSLYSKLGFISKGKTDKQIAGKEILIMEKQLNQAE